MSDAYEDMPFEVDPDSRAAIITMNRPERYNVFRGQTADEVVDAFRWGWADASIRSVTFVGPRGSLTDYQTHGRLRPCRSMRKSLT